MILNTYILTANQGINIPSYITNPIILDASSEYEARKIAEINSGKKMFWNDKKKTGCKLVQNNINYKKNIDNYYKFFLILILFLLIFYLLFALFYKIQIINEYVLDNYFDFFKYKKNQNIKIKSILDKINIYKKNNFRIQNY